MNNIEIRISGKNAPEIKKDIMSTIMNTMLKYDTNLTVQVKPNEIDIPLARTPIFENPEYHDHLKER